MAINWKFEIHEEVRIIHNKQIGMVLDRFLLFGWRAYQVKTSNGYFGFYEDQLDKTKLKICSDVIIQEIKFSYLEDGAFCHLTKWKPQIYWNGSQKRVPRLR